MAEPRENIQFNDTGGGNTSTNYTLPGYQQIPIQIQPIPIIPTQIPTNNTNIAVTSQPTFVENVNIESNIRQTTNGEGDIIPVKIANFIKNGIKRVTGRYSQNYFDFDTYDLSVINVINDEAVDFKFILCLKDGQNSTPQLYATKNLYETLLASYQYGNVIGANDIINERNIIVVDIQPLKNKIEDLRIEELNLDINLSNVGEKEYVTVFKNLFVKSNYESDNVIGLKANPTYDIIEVLRYISWVVSKPPQNYNNRVLPAESLGQWKSIEDETPSTSEPSNQTNNEVDDNNNPAPPPTPTYPPIGRVGRYDEEEQIKNGVIWVWYSDENKWVETNRDDIPGGDS